MKWRCIPSSAWPLEVCKNLAVNSIVCTCTSSDPWLNGKTSKYLPQLLALAWSSIWVTPSGGENTIVPVTCMLLLPFSALITPASSFPELIVIFLSWPVPVQSPYFMCLFPCLASKLLRQIQRPSGTPIHVMLRDWDGLCRFYIKFLTQLRNWTHCKVQATVRSICFFRSWPLPTQNNWWGHSEYTWYRFNASTHHDQDVPSHSGRDLTGTMMVHAGINLVCLRFQLLACLVK